MGLCVGKGPKHGQIAVLFSHYPAHARCLVYALDKGGQGLRWFDEFDQVKRHRLRRCLIGPTAGRNPIHQHAEQLVRVDGFGHKVHHAGSHALLFVRRHGIGSHSHDRHNTAMRGGANATCGFQAVHTRHLHIHQDHVIGLARATGGKRHVAGNAAVIGDVNQKARVAQYLAGYLLVKGIVLGQQNAGTPHALQSHGRPRAARVYRRAQSLQATPQNLHQSIKEFGGGHGLT